MRTLILLGVAAGLCVATGGVAVAQPPAPPADPVTSAPAWIGRTYWTTMLAGVGTRHVTYTLRRKGGRAAVTVVKREGRAMADPAQLREVSTVTYLGTATEKRGVLTIAVANGDDALELRCKRTTVRAASARAMRELSPGSHGCGDDGRWKPVATKRHAVLRCTPDASQDELIAFAPDPGIEWVFVNNTCLVGGGWRMIAADGSIMAAAMK